MSIHQTIHGYRDGHRLLSSSTPLSADATRTILVLSDMSGPSMQPGFDVYLTGYPWPGNLRECHHFIRKIFEAGGATHDPQWIQKRCQALKGTSRQTSKQQTQQLPTLPVDLRKETENLERQLYAMAAGQSTSIQQVAELLKVTRQTAARRMRYFKMTAPTMQSRRSTP